MSSPNTSNQDLITNLPPELILRILDYLHPQDERFDDSNTTHFRKLSTTCRTLHDLVAQRLLRDVTLTLHFDNTRPAIFPDTYHWAEPRLLEVIKRSKVIKDSIKRVRVEILPFPVKVCTRREYEAQLREFGGMVLFTSLSNLAR